MLYIRPGPGVPPITVKGAEAIVHGKGKRNGFARLMGDPGFSRNFRISLSTSLYDTPIQGIEHIIVPFGPGSIDLR